jgi:hypothetical protein
MASKVRVALGLFAVCGLLAAPVWADEPSDAAMRADIEVLKAKLARLEGQMAASDLKGVPSIGEKEGRPGLMTLPSGLAGLGLSGYVDTSYVYNFNEQNNFGNSGRVFDTEGNGFTIHAAEVVLEKQMSDESPIGFRTDLFFGDDADLIGATGLTDANDAEGTDNDQVDLQQAYVTYRAPIGEGVDIKVGKFVTLLGAEVIESPANWNFSRSYMFGYSIPFTHTGILATYGLPFLGESGSTTLGMVNGWDIVDDNNKAKSFLGNVVLGPWNNLTLSSNVVYGAEQANNSHDQRGVISNVLTWAPTDQWTFMGNWDYGHEEDAIGVGAAGGSGADNASWQGYALYARYVPTDRSALASRVEWFNDQDGVRVAPGGGAALAGSGHGDVEFFEWTLTGEYKLHEHLLARLEYRLDKANADVFRHDQGAKDYLNTVGLELVHHF